MGGVLLDGVVAEEAEGAVGDGDQDGHLAQIQRPVHHPELVRLLGDAQELGASVLSVPEESQAEEPSSKQGYRLDHIGPDHGLQPPQNGVDQGNDAADQDNGEGAPTGHGADGLGHQEEDQTGAEETADQIEAGGVAAGAVAEALLQELVGAHPDVLPVEGDHHQGDEDGGQRKHQVGEMGPPVPAVGLSRESDEGRGADGGSEEGAADGPPGDGPPADEVGLGVGLPPGQAGSQPGNHCQVG